MAKQGFSSIIFDYEDDGNFQKGNWTHRLTAIHLDNRHLPNRANSFGNILFYRHNDIHLLQTLMALVKMLC